MANSVKVIIGAMDEEVSALVARMALVVKGIVDGVEIHQGQLGGQNIVVAKSGIGKANAAYTAAILLKEFKPTEVINIGSAGGTKVGKTVGDVVVANKLQYHDFDIGPNTITDSRFIFENGHSDLSGIENVLKSLNFPYHLGLIVSGDQFVTKDSDAFKRIQDKFVNAIAVDMEATAIACACERNQTPWIVLRSLSDVTHNEGNDMDFETYLAKASANSALIAEEYLKLA